MKNPLVTVLVAALLLVRASAQAAKPLDVYFIDVEGGQATLFVTPSGESMLIDTGFPGNGDRDVNRVLAAIKQAGLTRLDYLLVTHYHADHAGNAAAIAARIPVGTFIDHGETVETTPEAQALYEGYKKGRDAGRHMLAKPGDKVPIRDLDVTIVSADGARITRPVAAPARANPLCAGFTPKEADPGENARSVGSLIAFGRFRMVDLGDLTWNKEQELVCPNNLLGTVDVYLTTHHGLAQSGPPVIVHALAPRVAIMNNGPKKGGCCRSDARPSASSPGLEDFWQLHYAVDAARRQHARAADRQPRRVGGARPQAVGAARRQLHRHQYPHERDAPLQGAQRGRTARRVFRLPARGPGRHPPHHARRSAGAHGVARGQQSSDRRAASRRRAAAGDRRLRRLRVSRRARQPAAHSHRAQRRSLHRRERPGTHPRRCAAARPTARPQRFRSSRPGSIARSASPSIRSDRIPSGSTSATPTPSSASRTRPAISTRAASPRRSSRAFPPADSFPAAATGRRDIAFSPDGRKMYIGVGSLTNVDDPDENAGGEGARGDPRVQPRRHRPAALRHRRAQRRRPRVPSADRQAVGRRSTSATTSATTSSPTTSRTSRTAASTAGRGSTWAAPRIRGTRASIRS